MLNYEMRELDVPGAAPASTAGAAGVPNNYRRQNFSAVICTILKLSLVR